MQDKEVLEIINKEEQRQRDVLELIPSENYVSPSVREALGSVLTNKYSEGYPKKRYYGGNEFIDEVEILAQERAKKLFQVPHVNVQPYSGSPANLAVYVATCKPGDTVLGLNLPDGGHLTHGWKASATSLFYNTILYHVKEDGKIDIDEVWKLAKEHKPKLIWTGATAYVYQYEFDKFAEIADNVGAYFVADIAHVAGLVLAGVHTNPVPYAHIITTTTHKTLRGPRGAMIMVTQRGLEKDQDLAEKIDKAVFPGLQGGPHDHQTAAIAVALKEAETLEFKDYGKQIVNNAKALAKALIAKGFKLIGNGTENHMMLVDLTPVFGPGGGIFAQVSLDRANITVNKNTIPNEPFSPFYPSGIRLGTPAITTRGMKEADMEKIAFWIAQVIEKVKNYSLPQDESPLTLRPRYLLPKGDKEKRKEVLKEFNKKIAEDKEISTIAQEVKDFSFQFRVP